MEDVLAVYQRPYDPRYPQVCLDEGSKQLVKSQRESLPMQSGKPQREDYEYEREGYCSVFVACEPVVGTRVLEVRPRRTSRDWRLAFGVDGCMLGFELTASGPGDSPLRYAF